MATLTVEGIPPGLLLRLAVAAAANGRCLNSEVIVHLARSANAISAWRRPSPGTGAAGRGPGWKCGCRPGAAVPSTGIGWGAPAQCELPWQR